MTTPTTRMVLDRFILQETIKKGYHVVLFSGHIAVLWYCMPAADALLYSGYTVLSYGIYAFIMVLMVTTGQFGTEHALPLQKQLAYLFPVFRIIIQD